MKFTRSPKLLASSLISPYFSWPFLKEHFYERAICTRLKMDEKKQQKAKMKLAEKSEIQPKLASFGFRKSIVTTRGNTYNINLPETL